MEDIQKRLERLERSVRYSKVLVIAMAVCTVAFATVPKARSLGSPFPLAASEFDLLGPGGKITAKLTTNDGGPNLLFYDNNGKLVEEVGINENTPASAGMAVLDGNSIIPGTGVVRESALIVPTGAQPFEGFATFDKSGKVRTSIGQNPDGSIAYALADDPQGNVRTGFDYNPASDFLGFFSQDPNGTSRSLIGQSIQDNTDFWFLNYPDGNLAVAGFTPSSGSPDVAIYDTSGLIRSLVEIELFETFSTSGMESGHIP